MLNLKKKNMKTNILKLQAILFTLAVFVAGCNVNKEEEIKSNGDKHESTETIIPFGKWKLINVTTPFVGESNDYSKFNIVYDFVIDFATGNLLKVSGEIEKIELYRGHSIGEHPYAIMCIDYEDGYEYRLTIDTTTYSYQISSEVLKFDNLPLDGSIYTLVKF